MMKLLHVLVLVIFGASTVTDVIKFAAANEPVPPSWVHWKWSGNGYFPQEFGLTLIDPPDGGECFVLFEEWGKLKSSDHWQELQRSHQLTYGSIHQVGDRTFIVFADVQRAAEFTIAVDGVLQLQWFPLATSKPADAELISGRLSGRIPGLPTKMMPGWEPSPKANVAVPIYPY